MRAMILAAGPGSRVFPYDVTRQKAALSVGQTSLAGWTHDCLRKVAVSEITVVVGHLEQRVRHCLRGTDVQFVRQTGTPGTVPAVLDGLAQMGEDESFLVVYGDVLVDEEGIAGFVERVRDEQPFAAAMLSPLEGRDSLNWICADMSEGRLTGVSGHPRGASHRLCGVYYFSPEAVGYVRSNPGVVEKVNVGGMPPMEPELAQSLQMMVEDGREVMAWEHTGLFVDVDKPWHILEANERFARYLCGSLTEDSIGAGSTIHDGAEINGHVRLGPNSHIGNRVVIRGNLIAGANTRIDNGAILGSNCIIGDDTQCVDYCYIGGASTTGRDCRIKHGAEFFGVLFDGVVLYHYCEMSGVFGARLDVGAATVCGTLRFDDGPTRHMVKGRPEFPEGGANESYFGDFTRTGVNAMIMPGVKVGAYSCVGPGVIQYDDVDHKTLVLAKQETVRKPWGPERYGW